MRRFTPAVVRIIILLFTVSITHADFADNQYVPDPKVLERILNAAEQYGKPLRSSIDATTSYYIRAAEYIGPCAAPFGTVHVAWLRYTRAGPPGTNLPARGHTFIVFADGEFRIRTVWPVDPETGQLSVSGGKILLNGRTVLDYAQLPANGTVVIESQPQEVPVWK